jgi:ankyrin repeat protein
MQANAGGETPLNLHCAVYKNNLDLVRCLVEEGEASVDQANTDGVTPLLIAAHMSYIDTVRWLVEEGKANINAASANGETPLIAALRVAGCEMEVDTDVPKFLLSVGHG